MSLSVRAVPAALFLLFFSILYTPIASFGQTLNWARSAGGAGSDEGRAIAVDAAGNVFIAGTFGGTADFDPGPGASMLTCPGFSNIFLAKYDVAGQLLWVRQLVSNGIQEATGLALTASGDLYLSGYFVGTVDFDPGAGTQTRTSGSGFDGFLARFGADGTLQWVRALGGAGYDEAMAVGVDAGGNAVVGGGFTGTAQFETAGGAVERTSAGELDLFLARYDAAGALTSVQSFGGAAFERVFHLAVDTAGAVYATGYFTETADFDPSAAVHSLAAQGDGDIFLAKYSAAGALAWAHGFGEFFYEEGRGVALDGTGAVYLTGRFTESIDFDPGPGERWLTSAGITDAFLAKFSTAGELLWAQAIGGAETEYATGIAADAAGNVYLGGAFIATTDLDPGPGEQALTSHGDFDVFVAKYDAAGALAWTRQAGSAQLDEPYALALDAAGHVYLTGFYKDTASEFGTPEAPFALPVAVGRDVFFAKYADVTTAAPVPASEGVVRLYPVPASWQLQLERTEPSGPAEITVYDQLGRQRLRRTVGGSSATLDVAELENGLYRLVIVEGTSRRVVSFVVAR